MNNLIEKIQSLGWEELEFNQNITVQDTEELLLQREDERSTLFLLKRVETEEDEVNFENSYSNLERIEFPNDFPLEEILTNNLKLRHYGSFNEVLNFNSNGIECLSIIDEVDTYNIQKRNNTVQLNPETALEFVDTYNKFYVEAESYKRKFVNYRSNQFQRSYFEIEKEKKTLSNKGEFSFLIDRFNLPTKRKTKDFYKYLNEADIAALQDLSLKMIQKEVFDPDFILKLNDYFIKERLEDIISLGRDIINLKSSDVKTNKAKAVIKNIEPDGRKIRQLESVWQNYFEKFLSFLIFSYRDIYSKIELNVNLKKKYPDFIGINHYGGVDVIEIKTHLKKALTKDKSHDNYAFSSEMSKAIIQTINYLDALIQEKIKNKGVKEDIKGKILEGNIYRPQGLIIISDYEHLVSNVKQTDAEFEKVKRDFTKLRNGLNGIRIMTFNELLDMAENYKDNIINDSI